MTSITQNRTTISKLQIINWIENTAQLMRENKDYLTQLDSPIGDADHGINMDRGFQKVMEKIESFQDQDIGEILKTTGMVLISSVGGASGPLYGTFYLQAGNALMGKLELSLTDLQLGLEAGLEGLKKRGQASIDEKTIVDALQPAVESLKKSVTENASLESALEKAIMIAEEGMTATKDMIARKGRASYLGERSIGHQDPGATSAYLILKALGNAVTSKKSTQDG